MTEPSNLRDAAEVYEEFAPIVEDSIYLAEHEAVMASIKIGGWLSAALDDPAVCAAMKADINRWFSAGFLYLDEVRKLMQTEREALEAECERLREALETIVNNCGQCGGYGTYPEEEIITGKVLWSDCSSPQCQEARAALKEIGHGDR